MSQTLRKWFLFLPTIIVGIASTAQFAKGLNQRKDIIVWNRTFDVWHELLELALDTTIGDYGEYTLISSMPMEQARAIKELEMNRNLHVAVCASEPERESRLRSILVPLDKGLLGYRICLIRQGEQAKFTEINSLEDWKKSGLIMGQGQSWPDTPILEANKLKVEKSASYLPLFDMLIKKRFDCFPRSVTEVLNESQKYGHKGLEIERNLLFVYPLPNLFFINKSNHALARRLEKGLRTIIENGEFDVFFQNRFGESLKKLNLQERTVIRLNNPFLTPATRKIATDSKFLFDPTKQKR